MEKFSLIVILLSFAAFSVLQANNTYFYYGQNLLKDVIQGCNDNNTPVGLVIPQENALHPKVVDFTQSLIFTEFEVWAYGKVLSNLGQWSNPLYIFFAWDCDVYSQNYWRLSNFQKQYCEFRSKDFKEGEKKYVVSNFITPEMSAAENEINFSVTSYKTRVPSGWWKQATTNQIYGVQTSYGPNYIQGYYVKNYWHKVPYDCREDYNCNKDTCQFNENRWKCGQCKQDYFKRSVPQDGNGGYITPCQPCSQFSNCQSCRDKDGCGDCQPGYYSEFDPPQNEYKGGCIKCDRSTKDKKGCQGQQY